MTTQHRTACDPLPAACDVLVVGSGNAGFVAAISAVQSGAEHVLLIDKCPDEWVGGNTYFTAGAYRTTHSGLPDLLPMVNNVDHETAQKLSSALTLKQTSMPTWKKFVMAAQMPSSPAFWSGNQMIRSSLVADLRKAALAHGVRTSWNTALVDLQPPRRMGDEIIAMVNNAGKETAIRAQAIILAAGGFESNPRMRGQFLGPDWTRAMVRGTPYNTGDCLEIAMSRLDAQPYGDWSGCHAVAWDANANPSMGDRVASNEHTKSGYPLGLMLNTDGRRFVDEGADLRNYTYAEYGRAVPGQPDHVAFQVWDSRVASMLRSEEYREERVERITANSIEELSEKCLARGLRNRANFVQTIRDYNEAGWVIDLVVIEECRPSEDELGPSTGQRSLPRSEGYLRDHVHFWRTQTVGSPTSQIINSINGKPIPGFYCCGEMLGGLFYHNYPGGSGLTSGAVFGRRAGQAAARRVLAIRQGRSYPGKL
ncbi:hypothetical protein ACCO45_012120 [Purpureocillium lilacinum]|uniref:Uncharacterized protein n=1 Tax=Purpureocillium lilacinum TaxID=33203 RepID=A0ACC4DF08_PURLI